ncbi:hypothetical protein MKX03_030610 [Papaver bracteatum]|nr:hypothetical protein MKX03_030610 [Papaver bracteatum]
MMKFVRSFNSLDLMRTFLETRSCLEELVVLEVEFGNCAEAANSAKLRGDLLLGAEILEKGGYYEEASRTILLYVLVNSLWTTGSKGWPLKKFCNKEELLTKSKLIAKTRNDYFYELICVEASSLSEKDSSLAEMGDCLATSQRLGHLGAEIMYLWKILDSHLKVKLAKYEQDEMVVLDSMKHAALMISRKRVSAQTLIYFWNTWREKILSILMYLGSIGTIHEKGYKDYEEFCLSYLGVCKTVQNSSFIYMLLNADAYWMKGICHRSLRRNGELVRMDAHQFVSAAQSYWVSEVTCLGMNVLEKLDTLYRFYGGKSLFNQGMMSLHILEVTKGLMESKVFDREAPKALLECSASSKQRFFGIICPADSKLIFSEDIFKLRKTELCRGITKEVIMEIISSKKKLPLGRLWKLVMLIFVYGSLPVELYQVIVNHFDLDIFWESFFEQFKDCIDSGIVRLSFLLQIRKSLGRTCQPNWSKMASYISPFHFSYLLERLLYLGSSWKPIYFTTKSSLLETLTCENWKLYSKSKSETDISLQAELCSLESFLSGFAHHILLGKKDTVEWFEKTDIASKRNYPSLVLRLSILVCLVCINSRNRFGHLYEILIEDKISSLLPVEFRRILKLAKPSKNPLFEKVSKEVDYNMLSKLFADVLKIIENPMVILYSGKKRPAFFRLDAIFVDMELITCREDILNILSLKRTECLKQGAKIDSEAQPFMENGGYETIWREIDDFAVNPLALEFNMELLIRVLNAGIAMLNLNASSSAEDRRFVTEADVMLSEVKRNLTALRVSGTSQENIQLILDRFGKLHERSQAMDTRLRNQSDSFFSMLATPNTSQVSLMSMMKYSELKERSRMEKDMKEKGTRN